MASGIFFCSNDFKISLYYVTMYYVYFYHYLIPRLCQFYCCIYFWSKDIWYWFVVMFHLRLHIFIVKYLTHVSQPFFLPIWIYPFCFACLADFWMILRISLYFSTFVFLYFLGDPIRSKLLLFIHCLFSAVGSVLKLINIVSWREGF